MTADTGNLGATGAVPRLGYYAWLGRLIFSMARDRRVSALELYGREPRLGRGALAALEIPDESIICPWTVPLAFATEAVGAGVRLLL